MLTIKQAISILEKDTKAKCNNAHVTTIRRIIGCLEKNYYSEAHKCWYQAEKFIAISPDVVDFLNDAKDAKKARVIIKLKNDETEIYYPVLIPSEIDLNSPAGQQFINTQLNMAVSSWVHDFLLVKFEEHPITKPGEEEDDDLEDDENDKDEEDDGRPIEIRPKRVKPPATKVTPPPKVAFELSNKSVVKGVRK